MPWNMSFGHVTIMEYDIWSCDNRRILVVYAGPGADLRAWSPMDKSVSQRLAVTT